MKIFIFVLFLIIGPSVFSAEEVLYCSDTDSVGFEPKENYKQKSYTVDRFMIKVDFENESLTSREIGFDDYANYPTLCVADVGRNQERFMICYSTFSYSTIKILLPELKFVRTFTFGVNDSNFIAHGECEKF